MAEHLTKEEFLNKVFNYEKNKEWKFEGELPAVIDFKWADNIQQTGDASDFTLNGDAAPNDRFNYRATLTDFR